MGRGVGDKGVRMERGKESKGNYKRCLVVYTLCAIASFPGGSKVIRGIMRGRRESLGTRLLC